MSLVNEMPNHESRAPGRDANNGSQLSIRRGLNNISFGFTVMYAIALIASGCSRNSGETSKTGDPTNQLVQNLNPASVQPPEAQLDPGTETAAQAEGQVNLTELNHAAKFWMFRNRRRPTSWDDFAAHAGMAIPPAPPGKKYVLSRDMRVSLVDR